MSDLVQEISQDQFEQQVLQQEKPVIMISGHPGAVHVKP